MNSNSALFILFPTALAAVSAVTSTAAFPIFLISSQDRDRTVHNDHYQKNNDYICNIHFKPPVLHTILDTDHPLYIPTAIQINLAINAAIQATAHCQKTTPTAHFAPNSRLMEAMAATQGVYKRENTSIVAAETVEIAV